MNIKAAFFDLDWTLFDHKNDRWDMESIEKIKELQKRGVKVFICTARPYHSFKWLGAFDLGIEWDGYIASAGGYAYTDGQYLHMASMKSEDVYHFIELAKERKLTLEVVELKDRILVAPPTKEAKDYYSAFKEVMPDVEEYDGSTAIGLNFFSPESEDAFFVQEFPNLVFFRFSPVSVDVMPSPRAKGHCLKLFLDHYGIKKDEAVAFGDDLQDISMASEVGYFVCMGNGKDEVKKVASYVTKNVWESGVGYAIEEMLENN